MILPVAESRIDTGSATVAGEKRQRSEEHEGASISESALREVQGHQAEWPRHGDLHESAPQAAAGLER